MVLRERERERERVRVGGGGGGESAVGVRGHSIQCHPSPSNVSLSVHGKRHERTGECIVVRNPLVRVHVILLCACTWG